MDSFELSVDSISFSYGKGEPNIFTDLSFSVKAGDTLALLGRNGVGKSTLLSCLMCFQQVQAGHIYWLYNKCWGYSYKSSHQHFLLQ